MKRIFKPVPEPSDYARFPQYDHKKVEKDGAIIEEVVQLSPSEIIDRASGSPTPDLSDNSGTIYPSSDYKDSFQVIDEMETNINKLTPDNIKKF